MITVMITAIGGGGHGEQILKALRLSKAGRYRIIGGDVNPHCPQFGLVDVPVVLPRASEKNFLDAVLSVAKKFGAKALFHGCEPEMQVYSREREIIQSAGLFLPVNPESVIRLCTNKAALSEFLGENGLYPIKHWLLSNLDEIEDVDPFPVVVKPYKESGGSIDCYVAQDRAELRNLMVYLGQTNHLMVQEYVGTPETEYTVGVLTDMDGRFINSIAVRRHLTGQLNIKVRKPNRTLRSELGETLIISSGVSHGDVGRFPSVTGPCERIAEAIGARGPLNIQCRVDGEGKVRVFEINPRFSGTTSIRALVGFNEPDSLIGIHLRKESVKIRFPYTEGMVVRNLEERLLPEKPISSWKDLI